MPNMQPNKTPMPHQAGAERIKNFDEVAKGYTAEMAMNEAARCLNCKNSPCVSGCPVNVQIPDFIMEIKNGNFKKAYEIITKTNALPAVCGRVCPQESQCEAKCVRGIKHESVAIGRLERFAADEAAKAGAHNTEKIEKNPYRVAVIGSGPAGIAAAGDLAKMGYNVTIFEAFHVAGGVLSYGIPEFRLPKSIVKREIDGLKDLGVEIRLDSVIGKLLTIDELFDDGYDAVFLGTGAGLPSLLGVPGEGLCGVFTANEFLTRINLGKAYDDRYDTPIIKAKSFGIIGGGNVAMDAARCARRLGAKVHVIYRRSEKEMPCRREELEHAKEEGVQFDTLTAPKEILGDENGWVKGIRCVKMQLGQPDQSGRHSVTEISGSDFVIDLDGIIVAIGTAPNPIARQNTKGIEADERGRIKTLDEYGSTTREGVFAGGDAVTGAATVIMSMGVGKKAAKGIDKYIKQKYGIKEKED